MKKFLLALVAILGISGMSFAQKTQLQIGYGGYTQMDATNMSNGGNVNTAWGALTAGINFQVLPKFKLGLSYTFSSSSYKDGHNNNIYYHVAMLNGFYDYYRNSIVKLYAHVGLGVDFSHMAGPNWKDNKAYFAYQFVPLGAEVGLTRSLGMFGELGFGAQGLVQVGLRVNI